MASNSSIKASTRLNWTIFYSRTSNQKCFFFYLFLPKLNGLRRTLTFLSSQIWEWNIFGLITFIQWVSSQKCLYRRGRVFPWFLVFQILHESPIHDRICKIILTWNALIDSNNSKNNSFPNMWQNVSQNCTQTLQFLSNIAIM